jgi:hypothetical protein
MQVTYYKVQGMNGTRMMTDVCNTSAQAEKLRDNWKTRGYRSVVILPYTENYTAACL